MKPRERWVIGAGAVVAVLVLFFRGGNGDAISSTSAVSNSLGSSLAQVENFEATRRNVKKMTSDLGVVIPQDGPSEQEISLRAQLTQLVQQNGLALVNLRRADAGGPRTATLKPIQFSLEINGSFNSLMNLVYALEHAPMPFLVQEMSAVSASGGQGAGANPPGPGGGPVMAGAGGPRGASPRVPPTPGAMPRGGSPSSPSPAGPMNAPPGGPAAPDPKQPDKVQCTLLVQNHIFPVLTATAQSARPTAARQNSPTSGSLLATGRRN